MRRCVRLLAVWLLAAVFPTVCFAAAGMETKPSCVLMKFTNATRYQALASDEVFASLVMERLLESRRFNLREATPLSEDMETMLYEAEKNALREANEAARSGDFSAMFEGGQFNSAYAPSISMAKHGQIVTPSVTSAIGAAHRADYLLHGTIAQIGNGSKKGGFAFVKTKSTMIGVTGELRIIKASTGKVIWVKRATGIGKQDKTTITHVLPDVSFGSDKLNANLYAKAMDELAQQLVDAMLADMNAHRLFVL